MYFVAARRPSSDPRDHVEAVRVTKVEEQDESQKNNSKF